MSKFKPGTKIKVQENICPQWMANRIGVVISYNAFVKGKPAHDSMFNRRTLADLQREVFVRWLDGKYKGKIDMVSPEYIKKTR
jgi:hypothetical protein